MRTLLFYSSEFWKRRGNESFVAKDYKKAADAYSSSIRFKGDNGTLWSNRSACYLGKELHVWEGTGDREGGQGFYVLIIGAKDAAHSVDFLILVPLFQ